MKKHTKLTIRRQTVRILGNSDLSQAAGGESTYSITEQVKVQKIPTEN